MNTLFSNTAVALHVSYLIAAQPPTRPCSLRSVLIMALEGAEQLTRQQAEWLARLIGTPSENVNFDGLTRDEVRGQCQLVMRAVMHRLPAPELCAMLARFAATEPDKRTGVEGVAAFLAPASPTASRRALTDVVWRRYLPVDYRDGFSFRAIEKRTNVSRSTLNRVSQWVDGECDGMELRALRRLEETFVPQLVCGPLPMQA